MTLVGKAAPAFTAAAVSGDGQIVSSYRFPVDCKNRYAILVFYPLDFTFVCPSELIALHHRLEAFQKRDCEIIAISIDSQYTHYAWRNTPVDQGGIGAVGYTLIADTHHAICRAYGVESEPHGVAFRASFLIDRDGIVRHQVVNDLPLGRDFDELLRMVDALQFYERHGEVCPAGWRAGEAGMKDSREGVAAYLKQHAARL